MKVVGHVAWFELHPVGSLHGDSPEGTDGATAVGAAIIFTAIKVQQGGNRVSR